jgi:arginine utilization regulatory protein
MGHVDRNPTIEPLGLRLGEFLNVFDGLSAGIIVTDRAGTIIYYNQAMARIDDCRPDEVIGKNPLQVYDLTDDTSMILQCLHSGEAIIDRPFYYRTRMGRVANTIHSVYPLFKSNRVCGAICIVREYTILEKTIRNLSSSKNTKKAPCKDTRFTFDSIIGETPELKAAVNIATMAADTPSPVMLYGETGAGKELFAQAIHNLSRRRKFNYTPVNCAAIPENLLEGILFGTSKGAFTGASNKPGLFERTNGGTIFLDELNSMAIGLQAKILRVIQERKVRRLGSLREVDVDLKIISSVNRQPHEAIAVKQLRPDLFYRLGVVFIPIPPLRERHGDIERLAHHFLNKHRRKLNKPIAGISDDVLAMFHQYHWPGNVRELEHVVEGALNFVGPGEVIGLDHLQSHLPIWYRLKGQESTPDRAFGPPVEAADTAHLANSVRPWSTDSHPSSHEPGQNYYKTQSSREKKLIEEALIRHRGNVTRAAKSIGISRQLLNYKMKKYGLNRKTYQ